MGAGVTGRLGRSSSVGKSVSFMLCLLSPGLDTCSIPAPYPCSTWMLPLRFFCKEPMYRSISGISSQALPRPYVCQGSADVMLIVGVVGVTGSFWASFDGAAPELVMLGCSVTSRRSSRKILVGFGASFSHGNIGAGFW